MRKLQELATCQYERFRALWVWCESIGTCEQCAIHISCAIVQKEAGNNDFGAPPNDRCTHDGVMLQDDVCTELVRRSWNNRPRKGE